MPDQAKHPEGSSSSKETHPQHEIGGSTLIPPGQASAPGPIPTAKSDLLEIKAGSVVRIRRSDLLRIVVVEESFDWKQFLKDYGSAIGAGVGALQLAYSIISNPSSVRLHQDSLRAIGNMIRQGIADAFFEHYTNSVIAMIERVKQAHERTDPNNKKEALLKANDAAIELIPNLTSPTYKQRALGGFAMAANLHLDALQRLSEFIPDFRVTFDRKRREYADHGAGVAEEVKQHLETRVGQCKCQRFGGRGEPKITQCQFRYDWGDGLRQFEYENDGEARRECASAREVYYQGGTVNVIQAEINPMIEVFGIWRR